MSDRIERYYSQRVKNLFNHIHDFEVDISESSLHDFRVELKKIKAVFKFLKFVYGKQEIKKITHLLDLIFQEAGYIREQQLMQSWIKENTLSEIEKKYFPEKLLKSTITSFHDKFSEYKKKLDELLKQYNKLIEKTNQIVADQYVMKLKHSIEKKLYKKKSEAEWHELRKIIKQWLYASNWVTERDSSEISQLYPYYNKLQEAIGVWHDKITIRESLLTMQAHLSKELPIQKDYAIALKKINASIKYTSKEVEQLLNKFKQLELN
jgi:CHAD domain-containing protein